MRLLATGPRSNAGHLFFYWPKLFDHFLSSINFPFIFFLSIGLYCLAGVVGLIACRSLTPSLALPTSFINYV